LRLSLSDRPQYKNWFLLGLLVQVIAAWFSVGYHHPDEQFQVLELCNYKLGLSPASDLPWEFAAYCRSGLQPMIAYGLSKLLMAVHAYDPFTVAFLLRLLTGLLSWWAIVRMVLLLLPEFPTVKGRNMLVGAMLFLWFVPYIGVRFSSDNISGVFLCLGISYLLQVHDLVLRQRVWAFLIAGFFLGLAFAFRLQVAFALLGIGIWIIFVKRWHIGDMLIICAGAIVAVGLSTLADAWLYGKWIFVPLNYYDVNIVQKKAAQWGTFPWYYYITSFFEVGVPPISLLLFPLFLVGIWRRPQHIFSMVSLTFLAGHLFIGHKELRFLFPMEFPFIAMACIGYNEWLMGPGIKPLVQRIIKVVVGINVALLVVKVVTPAQEAANYYRYIYNYSAANKNTTLVALGESPYHIVGLELNFYKPKDISIVTATDQAGFASAIRSAQGPVLYMSPSLKPGPELNGFRTERLYCLFPRWLLSMNINDWQSRSRIWTVFRVYPN